MKFLIAAFVFGSFAAIAADLNDAAPPRSLTGQVETRGDVTTSSAETRRLVAGQAERPSVAQTETVIETSQ